MRIVTLHTVGSSEWLSLVRLDQVRRSRVVTIEAKRGSSLREVVLEFNLGYVANLVGDVAGFATHFQRSVLAAVFRDVQSLRVAGQADVLPFIARLSLKQKKFVVRGVRAMALDAVSNRRRVNRTLQLGGIHISVTADAEGLSCSSGQFDSSYIFINANFVTTGTSCGYCRMYHLTLALLFVALDTLGRFGIFAEWDRMDGGE